MLFQVSVCAATKCCNFLPSYFQFLFLESLRKTFLGSESDTFLMPYLLRFMICLRIVRQVWMIEFYQLYSQATSGSVVLLCIDRSFALWSLACINNKNNKVAKILREWHRNRKIDAAKHYLKHCFCIKLVELFQSQYLSVSGVCSLFPQITFFYPNNSLYFRVQLHKVNKFQQPMFNTYKNDKKTNDKTQLRILDYRNGKYQGTTAGKQMAREGIGMVLDHNYLFSISSWKGGNVQGETVIIFPDNTLFYGTIRNKFPFGIGCYQVSGKLQIYSHIGSASQDLFALDNNNNKNLILLAVSRQIMTRLYEEPFAHENVFKDKLTQSKEKTKINLRQEVMYRNSEEKWDIIEKFFKTVLKNQMRSYKDFTKHYFQSQTNAGNKLEVVQSKDQVQISYPGSSILCKLTQIHQNDSDYRVKLLGYYNHNEHLFQLSKKLSYKSDNVEQTINQMKCDYPSHKRPANNVKHIHQYYKKSLQFVNSFLQIDYLYRVKFIYHSIETSIGELSINRSAQQLLENTNVLKESRPELRTPVRELKESPSAPYSIEYLNKAKEDIYNALKSKGHSRTKSISTSQLRPYHNDSTTVSRVNNPKNIYNPIRKEEVQPRAKAQDRKYLENSSYNNVSPGKRSFVYLEEEEESRKSKGKLSPSKYEYTKDALGAARAQAKSNSKLTKYKYLEKDEPKKGTRLENLTALTTYYEEIENQLRKETPQRSRRTYRNIDGVSSKRNTVNYLLKEGKREDPNEVQKKSPDRVQSHKKVYRYGWE